MSIESFWLIATLADWVDVLVNQLPLTAIVWITVVGACIGSFMNVVVYRLPAGMSLVHPPSHCPQCERPIRARDNLPVIGWLMLRGRCRDCGCKIPARYPLVEAAVALTFLALWLVDVSRPGDLLATNVRLGVFGLDAVLMSSLICIALIEMDGQVSPRRLLVYPLATLIVAIWLGPYLPFYLQRHQHEVSPLVGAVGGAVLGGALGWMGLGIGRRSDRRRGPIMTGALTGAYLSWVAVSMVAAATAALFLLTRRVRNPSPAARWSLIFSFVTLLFLAGSPFILTISAEESFPLRLAILIGAIALTTISGWFARD